MNRVELLKAMDTYDKFGDDPNEGLIPLRTPALQDRYVPYVKYDDMVNCVKNMTGATPQESRWIPVSERLPEDRREVLVTAYWHETYQVMMGSYYGDGLWWCVPFNNCGEHMQRLNPKAWMPLPKPYEPQESENT